MPSQKTTNSKNSTLPSKSSESNPSLPSTLELQESLQADAKALDIPTGSAQIFIKKAVEDAEKSLSSQKNVTRKSLDRALIKELKKYHQDLAYVYQNRDKII